MSDVDVDPMDYETPQQKVQRIDNTLAAEGLTRETASAEKIQSLASLYGLEASDLQDQFTLKREEQKILPRIEKVPQKSLVDILKPLPEVPQSFFDGIDNAINDAISRFSDQYVAMEDRRIEVKELPGNVDLLGQVEKEEEVFDKQERLKQLSVPTSRAARPDIPLKQRQDIDPAARATRPQKEVPDVEPIKVDPLMEQFDPSDEEFVNEVWRGYTGVLTPEKKQRALEDLKVYDELSDKEKFPKSLVKVSDAVNATKNPFQEGGNLSSREVKQALSKISYIEAKFENVDQKGGGPARSMFQVEPATAVSLINLEKNSKEYLQGSRYQRRMAKEFERLSKINETIKEKYTPNKDDKNGVYKTLASMSEEEIENLLSISPIFAGTIAYAKILTKMTEAPMQQPMMAEGGVVTEKKTLM